MSHDELTVFGAAFGVSAMGGLAALLRSDKQLRRKTVAAHMLNSGVLGLGVALVWYTQFQENIFLLVGLCVLLGLGGMSTVEFVTEAARRLAGSWMEPKGEKK